MIHLKGCLSPHILLATHALVSCVYAAPPVNVALKTPFASPPFLLELLETAAEENATSYFPLLDRIAEGHFDSASNDQELHDLFSRTLKDDGHISDPETLSSFQLALAIRSAAPRIEAHYQFYNTSAASGHDGSECLNWVFFNGQKHCSADLAALSAESLACRDVIHLPFDRVLGDPLSKAPSVLYADITSPGFRQFHKTISATARAGKTSYRIRYKPSKSHDARPLYVSGYGVELALKRTDYIVIDDREAAEAEKAAADAKGQSTQATLADEEVTDLRPLSSSELRRLDLKATSFVMGSEKPFETLLKLSQDFPKHSSALASFNISDDIVSELVNNRETFLPPGYNIMWINGVQTLVRDIDAFALLEILRRERKLINGAKKLGLSGDLAIKLFSHNAIYETQSTPEPQRYDWRDDAEGGGVIIWMNNIEKDKRYQQWPEDVNALLQRTFPGQLPSVRRNIHHVIVPVDFSDFNDVSLVVENVQMFVKRNVPIRFGLVPKVESDPAASQAILVRHLIDTYGLGAALGYLEKCLASRGKKLREPDQSTFEKAADEKKLRRDKTAMTFQQLLQDESLLATLVSANTYTKRLSLTGPTAPFLASGIALAKGENWMQFMSNQVSMDLRKVQQAVYLEQLTNADSLSDFLLDDASPRRNPIIIPEDDKTIQHVNLATIDGLREGLIGEVPTFWPAGETIEIELVSLVIVADFDSAYGERLLEDAITFRKGHDNVELFLIHSPGSSTPTNGLSGKLYTLLADGKVPDQAARESLLGELSSAGESAPSKDSKTQQFWDSARPLLIAADISPGEAGILINGRSIGPLQPTSRIDADDLETLLSYERKKRLVPAAFAMKDLDLLSKAQTPYAFALMSNMIALSTVSDLPEGIFEQSPTARTALFDKLQSDHSVIHTGDRESSTIQIAAAVDPASEQAQRWLPILKVMSELDGVYLRLFLNPRDRLEELPVKRFYRHVLRSKPLFDDAGNRIEPSANFKALPAAALLTIGMDMPPAWLVSPIDSVYDLDNLRLTSVKTDRVEATYQLDHILIEGHSRDITIGNPPRGAQLVLSTQQDPHFADTIIMSNLGYFQFKANPGFYNLSLQTGRSREIFSIDSAGGLGYSPTQGDESTEIALTSFRGSTLYPRVSRKPGMEEEDVLEPSKSAIEDLAEKAGNVLSGIGIDTKQAGGWLSKATKLGSSILSGSSDSSTDIATVPHADINIFSVASGHLYERMLNIMMVSVTKHTSHTVKFWFIEQFLSPSFKAFLPLLAEEYGFRYEMVTYKWPHWLRSQKEKQREIWGYKILFLDVLFPLDLDKVIFVDADQIVRTDMYDLVQHDLKGAAYGFTPMCDSRTEMEGFRFWKQGYWKNFLRGLPYHISALYVVDLVKFRQMAAGDRLRQQYHQLSADPASLSNLDQDLPNHMQHVLPIHSLPQDWLWCETWCSDQALTSARTIDLCNNPQTKEPKLERARRQVPEWTVYDEEIAALAKRKASTADQGAPIAIPGQENEQAKEQEEEYRQRLKEDSGEAQEEHKTDKHPRDEL